MGTDQVADILKVLVLGSGLAAFFIKDASKRRFAAIGLVVACTALVGYTFYLPFIGKEHDGKSQAVMDSSTAEFVMKLSSAFDDLMREIRAFGVGSVLAFSETESKKLADDMHEQAFKAARSAVKRDPTAVSMRFRQLVIAGEARHALNPELNDLRQLKDKSALPAALLIEQLYEKHFIGKLEVASALSLAESLTSRGWLRDVTTIEVYRSSGEQSKATKLLDTYHTSLVDYAGRCITAMFVAFFLGFVGTLLFVIQFFFWPRKLTSDSDRTLIMGPQDYGFLKIYGVFIGWLALECVCAPFLGDLAKFVKRPSGAPDPLTIAIVIFVIYCFTNVPALFIAWLVAIKPTGVRFIDSIKLRMRVGSTGPVRLVLSGIGAWLCSIPLVMVSVVVSKNMQSQGSANPILPIISEVVRSGGFFTIALFIFVLGVMPALCEETLFRGFLYTSLRVKHNVFVSVAISAFVFAAVHMDPGAFGQLFVLGAVFALVMERTKSLLPSMIAHCLWNSGTLVLMMVAFGG